MLARGAEAATTEIDRIGDEDPKGISGPASASERPNRPATPG